MKVFLVVIVGLAALISTGCDRLGAGKPALRLANWGGAGDDSDFQKTVRSLYTKFEEENPGIDLQIEGTPDAQEYRHKMLLSFIAKSEPDVITVDASSAADFIDNGILQDLEPFIAKDPSFSLDPFFPNVVDITRREKGLYAIPVGFTPMVMYYNKRLFDKAGVAYPKDGWTFQDFLDKAKKLTKGDQYGYAFTNWMPGWVMWLWNNGGDVLDPKGEHSKGYFDSPQSIEAIEFIASLVKDHKVSPSLSQTAATGVDYFANARAAMTISGHWSLVTYNEAPKGPDGKPLIELKDLGIVSLPTNVGKSSTVMYEAGVAIGKHSRDPEAAWKFIKFFTSFENAKRYNNSGIEISARKDVARANATTNLKKDFLKIVETARGPWGAQVPGYTLVEKVGQSMMDSILQNNVPVKVAVEKAVQEIDQELAKQP